VVINANMKLLVLKLPLVLTLELLLQFFK